MTWQTPPSWVSGQPITSAALNIIRDDLLETMPAKATTAGRHFVASGTNSIVERRSEQSAVGGLETGTMTSWGNLATSGPAVTVTCSAKAWISIYSSMANTVATSLTQTGYEISGATSQSPADSRSIGVRSINSERVGMMLLIDGLTSGSNTFTMKYQVTGNTGEWNDRRCSIMAL